MVLGIWSRSGSDKAKSSQAIRILLRSLQYLAEEEAGDEQKYIRVVVPVIRNLFKPDSSISINLQIQEFFDTLGWKNTQITVTTRDKAKFILGSNRFLEQADASIVGLTLFVKTLCKAVGYYVLNKEVDPLVKIDLSTSATYTIELKALEVSDIATTVTKVSTSQPRPSTTKRVEETRRRVPERIEVASSDVASKIEIDQLFLPIVNSKIPLSTAFVLLQDVMAEFAISWFSENPIEGQTGMSQKESIVKLVSFLVEKSSETARDPKVIGNQVGKFFGQAMQDTFKDEFGNILSDEIIESNTQVIIRDIKAMSLCTLSPGDRCVKSNRAYCDFAMGIYEGVLSHILGNEYEFTTYFAAGRRDRYCLMEFHMK